METVDMVKKKGLGRGLGALLEKTDADWQRAGAPLMVPIDSISPNPYQPRSKITDKDIKSLSESIKDHGVLEPLLVRTKDGQALDYWFLGQLSQHLGSAQENLSCTFPCQRRDCHGLVALGFE